MRHVSDVNRYLNNNINIVYKKKENYIIGWDDVSGKDLHVKNDIRRDRAHSG